MRGAKFLKKRTRKLKFCKSHAKDSQIKETIFQSLVAWGPSTRCLCTPVYYYRDNILRGTIIITGQR